VSPRGGSKPRPLPKPSEEPADIKLLRTLAELQRWGCARLRYDAVVRLHAEGWTDYRIAKVLGITGQAIRELLARGEHLPSWTQRVTVPPKARPENPQAD
jgi:hypothetical protein